VEKKCHILYVNGKAHCFDHKGPPLSRMTTQVNAVHFNHIYVLFYAYISHTLSSINDFTVKICMRFLFLFCLLHALPTLPFFIRTPALPNSSLKMNFNWKRKCYWIKDNCR